TFNVQFLDWDGDGRLDMVTGLQVYRNQGNGNYEPQALLAPGNHIDHPGIGDGWMFTQLADLDGDGRLDLLYGTHSGPLYLHRNLGGKPARFDERGERLLLADGQPIHVGPVP